jgi:hypothetical protein
LVGAVVVVLESPVFEEELGFVECVEAFHVEELAAEVAVERFDVGVLPGCSGFDVAGVGVVEAAPVAKGLAHEFGAVVAADHPGRAAALLDDPFEHTDGLVGTDPPCCRRGECLACVLVGDSQDLDRSTVGGSVADEVDRPHLIGYCRGQVSGHPRPTPSAFRPDR